MAENLRLLLVPILLLPLFAGFTSMMPPRAPKRQDSFAGIHITKAGFDLAPMVSYTKNVVLRPR